MADKLDTGGAAYPLIGRGPEDDAPIENHGMTLLDAFALAAMQGILVNPQSWNAETEKLAEWAYAIALAMLAERKRLMEADNAE